MAEVRRIRGRIHIRLNEAERVALLDLVDILGEGEGEPVWRAVYDDPEMASEFEALTGPELAAARSGDIDVVRSSLSAGEDTCALTESNAYAWIRGLNHLRLVAANRLGIDHDGWQEEADLAMRELLEFRALIALAYIQEELVAALQG